MAYQTYFYVYWTSYALEAILSLLVIYSIFKLAMAPLEGSPDPWNSGLPLGSGHLGRSSHWCCSHSSPDRHSLHDAMITQLQQTSSILTLCLLLFVCFAIRPMGLSYQQPDLRCESGTWHDGYDQSCDAAWFAHSPNMYSTFSVINGLAVGLTLVDLVSLLCLSGAEAPHHCSADDVAVPSLEPDFNGTWRRSGVCGGWRDSTGTLCSG